MDFVINARGHVNVLSLHKNTIEVTREEHLTPRGDCIVAVGADKGLKDIPEEMKKTLKGGGKIRIKIECNGLSDVIRAVGCEPLSFQNPECMVIRKSAFVCPRTLAILADKAASDINRELVSELKKGEDVKVTLSV